MVRTAAYNGQVAFDPSFANNQLSSKIIVKIQLADLNQHAISYADPNHYLFRFSAV